MVTTATNPRPDAPLIAEPGTPEWFGRFIERIRFSFVRRSDITFLQGFQSTALPDPVKYYDCIIAVTDKGVPAYSNGTFWYPITLGTHY